MRKIILSIAALLIGAPCWAQCMLSGVTDQYTYFVAVDSADFTSRETGLSSFTVYRSRNGGAAAAFTTPTVNETDNTNMPGVYELLLDEDMTIDSGDDVQHMTLHITHAGMAPVTKEICIARAKITAGETVTATSGRANADMVAISTDTSAADELEAFLDLRGGGNGAFPYLGIHASGTAQAYTAGTPSVTLASSTAYGDDGLNCTSIAVRGSNEDDWMTASITDYDGATDVATIDAAFPTAPTGTITYVVWGVACGSGGGSGDATAANQTEILSRLPDATPGSSGGLPTVDSSNRVTSLLSTGTGSGQISLSSGLLAWNPAWDAEVQSEAADALNAYDPPTHAELSSALASADDAVLSAIAALENLSAEDVWTYIVETEGSVQARCAMAAMLAIVGGDLDVTGTSGIYEDATGTETRLTYTITSGDRAATITCPTY